MSKVILGLDPGTLVMGFAAIRVDAQEKEMLDFGEIYLKDIQEHYARLAYIMDKIKALVAEFGPAECAIEAPFFGKNVQSMLKLGRAQGVAIASCYAAGLPVTEYSPKEIKKSITGRGQATKEQVWAMLKRELKIDIEPKTFDGTDALAVALCHHYRSNSPIGKVQGKSGSGWEAFIAQNPDRIK